MKRMQRLYLDSHKTFKPFTIEQGENETEREFERRAWEMYCKLVDEHETSANGNRVYMNYVDD